MSRLVQIAGGGDRWLAASRPRLRVRRIPRGGPFRCIQTQSESEEEEIVEQVIIKKKSNNNNKPLTNDEKVQLIEKTAEERLKESLKNDRINYLLNQIGAKL